MNGNNLSPQTPLEKFSNDHNGNADRFYSRYGSEVLYSGNGQAGIFYTVEADGRWHRNEGAGAGGVEQKARVLVDALVHRGKQLKAGLLGTTEQLRGAGDALLRWGSKCSNLAAMQIMAKNACLTYGLSCTEQDFDNSCDVLALGGRDSGWCLELNKDTGSVLKRRIDARDKITFQAGCEYIPELLVGGVGGIAGAGGAAGAGDRTPAAVREYLETFMPEEEKQRLVFKALGSCLLGGNASRSLLIFLGGTTTGKSQLQAAVSGALGDYCAPANVSIFRGNLDEKPRPDVIKTLKKRVIFLSEASKAWELHADRVKALTGGDEITVRALYREEITCVPQFTPILVTNTMPKISGADKALKRRLIVIPFDKQPVREDPAFKARFLADLDVRRWLLARMVAGWRESVVGGSGSGVGSGSGSGSGSSGLDDVRAAFALEVESAYGQLTGLDSFFEWLEDSSSLIVLEPDQMNEYGVKTRYVLLKDLHDRYVYWALQHGDAADKREMLSYKDFNRCLRESYGWVSIKNNGSSRWEGRLLAGIQVGTLGG